MIDMLEKEPLNQSAESSKERIPENYQLRYFTEMEVAGLMGFPKCFSFPSELTTRQVNIPFPTLGSALAHFYFNQISTPETLLMNYFRGMQCWVIL